MHKHRSNKQNGCEYLINLSTVRMSNYRSLSTVHIDQLSRKRLIVVLQGEDVRKDNVVAVAEEDARR